MLFLFPAPGKDYANRKEVVAEFEAGTQIQSFDDVLRFVGVAVAVYRPHQDARRRARRAQMFDQPAARRDERSVQHHQRRRM